jgi:hypothetical protein
VDPILAAVMCDRHNRPDIWPQSLRSELHSASCEQGAVHIWIPGSFACRECPGMTTSDGYDAVRLGRVLTKGEDVSF